MCFGEIFDLGEVHHHPVGSIAGLIDNAAGQGDFDGVAVPVQVSALAFVIRDAMPGIEFEAAGNKHGSGPLGGSTRGWRIIQWAMLTTVDHRRDSAGLLYVYPVISRRAGGVSVGINLNPNNACNWACRYCQVENLTRGGPPAIDLQRLKDELSGFLDGVLHGDFMNTRVPESSRRLVDVAFSGNGEPTSALEFPEAVALVGETLAAFGLKGQLPIRLITNGSLMHREGVQLGIRHLGALAGEVWFKIDRALAAEVFEINGVPGDPERVSRALSICVDLAPTWVQTCWFAFDGRAPDTASEAAYFELLRPFSGRVAGIHLYGLARPSMQPEAGRLAALPADALFAFAQRIQEKTGIKVNV